MRTLSPLALALILVATTAAGGEGATVYVNGVNVEGLKSQTFEKVTVRIDERGNVHILAPGYSVKRVSSEAEEAPRGEAVLSRRYFLVTEGGRQGMVGYEVELFLNGKYLRTVSDDQPLLVEELTLKVRPGRNSVVLQARKRVDQKGPPPGQSKDDLFRVLVGEGTLSTTQVTIERQLAVLTRTGADTEDLTQEFSFITR